MRRSASSLIAALVLAACSAPRDFAPTPGFEALVGDFAGELRMGPDLGRTVPMQLLVAPRDGEPDRYRFRLAYGGGGDADSSEGDPADVRDYLLVVDDRASGRCHVDERDGIELAGRLVDGELVTVFQVGSQVLDVRYRVVPEGIEFSLVSYDPATGEVAGAGLEGPPLRTFAEVAHQRALLRRR